MMLQTSFRVALIGLILAGATLSFGCGGPAANSGSGGSGPTSQAALEDLATLLKSSPKPPARLADLEPHSAVYLSATMAIQQKTIVYVWGKGITAGQEIIAYDAKAPTDGGGVLLQDGSVKSMTADEFKAAFKPAGK